MKKKVQIHGHRGARGLYPENTIVAFIEAIKLGVDAIELDVVISKDEQVVVSHEEWMNEEFCLTPETNDIAPNSKEEYNLYDMNYAEIKLYDCGSKPNKHFPQQKNSKAYKPLLTEVIEIVETFIKSNKLKPIIYNIEIKSEIVNEPVFQPAPAKIVELVLTALKEFNIDNHRLLIQSFDVRVLQELKKLNTAIPLGLLIENSSDYKSHLIHLGFKPEYYNPEYVLVTSEMISYMHQQNINVIPWTVNELTEIESLIKLGVDGIITDYPNLILTQN